MRGAGLVTKPHITRYKPFGMLGCAWAARRVHEGEEGSRCKYRIVINRLALLAPEVEIRRHARAFNEAS